jgi:hypothetical protein
VHVECVGITPEFFHRKLNEFNKKKGAFSERTTVTSKLLLASFKVVYRIAIC